MLRAMTAPVAHVLVVEDEAAIAETVLYALRSEGYAASHCLLGKEFRYELTDEFAAIYHDLEKGVNALRFFLNCPLLYITQDKH